MLNDRIVIRRIIIDEKPRVLHDCSVSLCSDLCGFYDEEMYHITGDYMLQGNIEVVYIKAKYTRLQRILIRLLKYFCVTQNPGNSG